MKRRDCSRVTLICGKGDGARYSPPPQYSHIHTGHKQTFRYAKFKTIKCDGLSAQPTRSVCPLVKMQPEGETLKQEDFNISSGKNQLAYKTIEDEDLKFPLIYGEGKK
ncbi:hypothetical protein JZ751_005569, partial [Albula glossodonta]